MLNAILVPVLILTGVGVAAGVMLSLASKFMAIPVDARLEEVREALPGINCGACGYAGCDQYAKAIVEEGASTSRCIPGGDNTSKLLSELMGTTDGGIDEMVAYVACKGVPGEDKKKLDYKGIDSCYASSLLYGGDSSCSYGCLGYGDCAKSCPFGAIDLVNGIAVVRPEVCTGCSLCVTTCPKALISMYPLNKPIHVECRNKDKGAKTRKVCANGCIACKKCANVCPTDAITVEENLAFIDVEKCITCGKCIEVCPVNVIERFHPTCEA